MPPVANRTSTDGTSDNPNITWAAIFVDELARGGLKVVCIAPGSRSTPLALAFDAHPAIRVYLHLDERSAAFFALGMALAADTPVALVCTSGTAAANFYPAIVEARLSQVPLLVLTADRPPELRHSGANQTIDQVKLYGDQVLWFVDVALPQTDAPPVATRNLHTLAARALATANGLVKGPVHLNFPFRKPLEPELGDWRLEINPQSPSSKLQSPFTQFERGILLPTNDQLNQIADVLNQYERGFIVCGPRGPGGDFAAAVAGLSRRSGYPILADPLSGVRFGEHVADTAVIGGYETFLAGGGPDWDEPEVIVRFGALPTSRWLNAYLDRIDPAHHIHIRDNGVWADDSHRTSLFLQADPAATCRQLAQRIEQRHSSGWTEQVCATEAACWQAMSQAFEEGGYFDGAAVADVIDSLPPGARLFVGNSLPIRHLDQFGRPQTKPVHAFANRGASGIDGNISTGLGIGATNAGPLALVVGDITFYHDMNGLLAVKNLGINATIVLLNNNGGGIFHRLPVSQIEPPFTRLFITPHGLNFEPAARLYGLDYVRADDQETFYQAFTTSMSDTTPRLIEVRTDGRVDHQRRQEVVKFINESRSVL